MSTTRRLAATLAVASAALVAPATQAVADTATAPKPFTGALASVTSTTLNIRTTPSMSSATVATAHRRDVVQPVCSTTGQSIAGNRTWYWVMGPANGWMSAKYLTITQGRVPACSANRDMRLMNAQITKVSQVNTQLAGTSASFRRFITAELVQAQKWDKSTPGCHTMISVSAYWKDNQAIGDVNGCGGYAALWTYRKGAWHELGTQSALPCTDLRKAGATHAINGNTGWVCSVPSLRRNHEPVLVQYDPRG